MLLSQAGYIGPRRQAVIAHVVAQSERMNSSWTDRLTDRLDQLRAGVPVLLSAGELRGLIEHKDYLPGRYWLQPDDELTPAQSEDLRDDRPDPRELYR